MTKKKASKRIAKKKASKKKIAKKKATRHGASHLSRTAGKVLSKKPSGYTKTENNILVPDSVAKPVSASKLRKGITAAKNEINNILEDIVSTMNGRYVISEIELSASFNADGKFMGFGVGGATTIKIKITPE